MPVTGLRGRQILDGDVFRNDLNVTSSTQAVVARIIAGTGITISSSNANMTGTGDVTINASGVTSVGLSLPNIFSISGSPVTSSGTLTGTFVSQTANTFFAAPNGSNGTPTFRALVAADIPALTLENLPDAWVKRAVRVATTANITLSGTQTIDGISVVAGDRVLVKNQSTSSQNGIYVVAGGSWTRATDSDAASEIAGAMVAVDLGTTNGGTTWDTDFRSSDTIGTTAMTWFRVIDTGYGAALTKTDDTNVTLTLGGTPSTALIQPASLTLGWTGQLAVGRGGTGASTLTGVLIGNGTSAFTAVSGTASQLLRRNSGNSAYEFFSAGNLTRTDDTNVTLTLGGTPTGSLINAVSLTLGWSGQLAVSRGGTGASTLTGVLIGNGTSAVTAVAGTASQLLRRNAANTAYEFFTFSGVTGSGTNGTIPIWTGTSTIGDSVLTYSVNTLTFNSTSETILKITGDGQGYTHGSVLFQTGTNATNTPTARGLGTYYFNEGNDVIWFVGNAYNSPNTDTISFIRLSSATFTASAADPAVGTRLFYIDINKSVFANQIQSVQTNNTATGGGQIYLNGTGGNRIDWAAAGIAAPSYTTRSVGTKLVLYPSVNASQVDYGFGIDSDTLWASVAVTGGSFKWYGGTQINMHLSGQNLLVGSGVGVGAGRLTVGAASGGTSLYLTDATNSTLYVTHTSGGRTNFFNGTATQWLMEVGGNVTIGNSTSAPSKLWIYNTTRTQNSLEVSTSATETTLQTTVPLRFNDLYNSGANGHNLFINSTAASGLWEYNITKTWGGILTLGSSTNGTSTVRHLYIYDSGQIRLANYTTTSSFSGTAVGVLAFTSDGSIITIPTPGGGSGLTGSGTTNYVPKFTGSTTLGNSTIFDNGSDVGIGTATPTNTANYRTLHVQGGATGAIVRFSDSTGTSRGYIYGSTAETAINAVGAYNLYVANVNIANATTTLYDVKKTLRASNPGSQIQITGGATEAGIFMAAANNFLYISDWATAANGLVVDVSNGITRLRSSSASGTYFQFQRSTSTDYGYIGNAAQLCFAPFNATTDLAIRSEGAILFATSGNARAAILGTGQLRLINYTTTSSFTGTAVGVLAFDASGNILTIATPGGGGSSQWTTNGSDIYYNTGRVGIGATTPSQALHIVRASGVDSMIRFDQTSQRTYEIGILASTQSFTIRDVSATANRLQVLGTGQLVLNAYTSVSSFTGIGEMGIACDASGNIITTSPPSYRLTFLAAGNFILNNVASGLQFFNNQTAYIARADLKGFRRVRLLVQKGGTAGTSTTKLILRYRTTYSNTTTDYSNIGTSEVSVTLNFTNSYLASSWIDLAAAAKTDVFIALMQSGGDGAVDPVLGNIYAEFGI